MSSTSLQFIRKVTTILRGRKVISGDLSEAGKVYTKSGAINNMPERTEFYSFKIIGMIFPGLLSGAFFAKWLAEFMEENDIFIPSDDD